MKGELTNRLLNDLKKEREEKLRLEQIEILAAKAHEIWSHWMHHMFNRAIKQDNGDIIIPSYLVERWKRQMNISYENLTEAEKQSDRRMAKRFLL